MREIGYIKFYRQLLSWEWYSDLNTTRIFIHLLLTVTNKGYPFQGLIIPRGSIVTTYEKLAADTNLTPNEIRRTFVNLKSTGEITTERMRNKQLVTLLNYAEYQARDGEEKEGEIKPTPQAGHKQSTGGQQAVNRPNEQELKELKELKNIPPISPKGEVGENKPKRKKKAKAFVPPTLAEVEAYCLERKNFVDPKAFFDYFEAGNWINSSGKPVLSWKQTVVTWERYHQDKPKNAVSIDVEPTSETESKDVFYYMNGGK